MMKIFKKLPLLSLLVLSHVVFAASSAVSLSPATQTITSDINKTAGFKITLANTIPTAISIQTVVLPTATNLTYTTTCPTTNNFVMAANSSCDFNFTYAPTAVEAATNYTMSVNAGDYGSASATFTVQTNEQPENYYPINIYTFGAINATSQNYITLDTTRSELAISPNNVQITTNTDYAKPHVFSVECDRTKDNLIAKFDIKTASWSSDNLSQKSCSISFECYVQPDEPAVRLEYPQDADGCIPNVQYLVKDNNVYILS